MEPQTFTKKIQVELHSSKKLHLSYFVPFLKVEYSFAHVYGNEDKQYQKDDHDVDVEEIT